MSEPSLQISEDFTDQEPKIDPRTGQPKHKPRLINSILFVVGILLVGLGICLVIGAILSSRFFEMRLDELGLEKVRDFNAMFLNGTLNNDIQYNRNVFTF